MFTSIFLFRFKLISSSRKPTLNECCDLFLQLHNEYSVEYKLYGLDAITKSTVLPALQTYFARWDPLDPENVRYGVNVLEEWRDILAGKVGTSNGNSMFDHFKNDSGL